MVRTINRKQVEATRSLAEAVNLVHDVNLEGRLCVLGSEAMEGKVAKVYDKLGLKTRRETYKKIAEDFKTRAKYYDSRKRHKHILDVGCGSGLLSYELADRTKALVIGIDISKEMIDLANKNKQRRAEEKVNSIIEEYERDGLCDFSQPIPAACDPMPEIVDVCHSTARRTKFVQGSVYDLSKMLGETPCVDYLVCRNALHRFQNPQEALRQMLSVVRPGGKIYIRDLRRDADWKIIVNRIGEERWKHPELVRDYIGAMASTFTPAELDNMLASLDVEKYRILDGSYSGKNSSSLSSGMNEYEKEVEYVCVIKK